MRELGSAEGRGVTSAGRAFKRNSSAQPITRLLFFCCWLGFMKTTHSPVNYCRPCDCCVCVTYTERGRSTLLPRSTRSSQNEILVTHILKTFPSFQDVRTFSMLQPFQSKGRQQELWSCKTFFKKKKKHHPRIIKSKYAASGPNLFIYNNKSSY